MPFFIMRNYKSFLILYYVSDCFIILRRLISSFITIDQIRKRFGYKALVRASSLTPGGTAIERSGLVGGHHA